MRWILCFVILLVLTQCRTNLPSTEKKAVFIILDGIPADVLEEVDTPVLDSIANAGGYSRAYVGGEKGAYSETPTISAPGYMDLLTATWANKHNVWNNDDQSPNYNYWNIFRIVKNARPNWQTAIFSTWLDNRTVLIGEGQTGAGDIRMDYAYDGLEKDTLQFPHDTSRTFIFNIDEAVSKEAARYIAEKGPHLSWVYLEFTDDMGHKYGDSEEFYKSVRSADVQVGRIWQAVSQRQAMGEDWMMVITTDHGRDALTGKDHGGQSDRERATWIVTNASDLNARFGKPGMAVTDITPSILRHLEVEPPQEVAMEMDGTPFASGISLGDLQARIEGNQLLVSWKAYEKTGNVELSVAFSNNFKTGGKDNYESIGSVPLSKESFTLELTTNQQQAFATNGIAKVVAKGEKNLLNRWVVRPTTNAGTEEKSQQ